jgi:hypothetical protein
VSECEEVLLGCLEIVSKEDIEDIKMDKHNKSDIVIYDDGELELNVSPILKISAFKSV